MDLNTNAFQIVRKLTEEGNGSKIRAVKQASGKAGGRARAAKLEPRRRQEIAEAANRARWGKEK